MPCHLTSQSALYAAALAWHGCKRANHVKARHLDRCQRLGRFCMQIQPVFESHSFSQVSPPGAVMRLTVLSKVSGEPSAPRINWQHDKFSRGQMGFKRSTCATNREPSTSRAGCGIVTGSGAQCFGGAWSEGGFKGQLTGASC